MLIVKSEIIAAQESENKYEDNNNDRDNDK